MHTDRETVWDDPTRTYKQRTDAGEMETLSRLWCAAGVALRCGDRTTASELLTEALRLRGHTLSSEILPGVPRESVFGL
jgi:hypothetical protein